MLRNVAFCLRRMDWGAFLAQCLLLTIGVIFIYSACFRGDPSAVSPFYKKQMCWIALGLAVFFVIACVDYQVFSKWAYLLFGVALLLLVAVLIFGPTINGAKRWIRIGGLMIQPSEIAKIATMLTLARFLARPGRDPRTWGTLLHAGLLVGVPFFLILKEPDLGTAMVLVPMALGMLFAAGVRMRSLFILAVMASLLMPFAWFGLNDYQQERILVFVNPDRDPLGAGWNRIQSEIAVGSGGFAGKGYLQGTQNILGFLPRTVAPTDFIFPVIAEETGFVGSLILMALFAILLVTIFRTSVLSTDRFGRLLAVGMGCLLFSHVFVNIAMTIGLMPITGLPLPFISYGGSFTVSMLIGTGMVQSIFVRRLRR